MISSLANTLRDLIAAPRARFVLGSLLAVGLIVLGGHDLDLRDAALTLQRADAKWVLAATLTTTLHMVAKAARWRKLLAGNADRLSLLDLIRVLLIGQMLNTLIPLRIGDVARVFLLGSRGVSRAYTAGTIAMEKGVDLLSYGALFFCSCSGCPCPSGSRRRQGLSSLWQCRSLGFLFYL